MTRSACFVLVAGASITWTAASPQPACTARLADVQIGRSLLQLHRRLGANQDDGHTSPPMQIDTCYDNFSHIFAQLDLEDSNFVVALETALKRFANAGSDVTGCSQVLTAALAPARAAKEGGGYGVNTRSGWEYTFSNDCFKTGQCPEGEYCQVRWRETFYPYDDSYINRGRCVKYLEEGMPCTGDADLNAGALFGGEIDEWTSPPGLCPPDLACARGILSLPAPVCVKIKSQVQPCMISWPMCSGRDPPFTGLNGTLDWTAWLGNCASNKTCRTVRTGGFSRPMLEACAAKVINFGGENSAMIATDDLSDGMTYRTAGAVEDASYTNDTKTAKMGIADMHIDRKQVARFANSVLPALWPYPICRQPGELNCTIFPIAQLSESTVGDILGKYNSEYHCEWGLAHTLMENGDPTLTEEEVEASHDLIKLYLYAQSCKVCRTNFAHLVKHLGYPAGSQRENHAAWWWQVHNNVNEHSYAVHSLPSPLAPRVGDWANPVHMIPWFTPRKVARKTWRIR